VAYGIKRGYRSRKRPTRYVSSPETEGEYQAGVYAYVQELCSSATRPLHVLDIGCGLGVKTADFVPVAASVVGMDYPGVVRRCEPVDGVEWFGADIEDLPDLERNFDLILAADVIEHLVWPSRLLRVMRAHAHARTRFVLSTPERDVLRGEAHLGPPANPAHVREWNSEEFVSYLSSARFHVVQHQVIYSREDAPLRWCQVALCRLK